MSRVLPNAVIGRAFLMLGVQNEQLAADLPKMVDVGRQKLYGFQHEDGGWGWWFDDPSHDYQSAYILFGLALTEQAGFEVDDGVMARGGDYLRQNLGKMDLRTRAYTLYALATAGQGEPEQARQLAAEVLAGQGVSLDPFSQAALALALHSASDDTTARQLVDGLVGVATRQDNAAFWNTGIEDGHYCEKTMSSSVRSTALVLDALVQIEPDHALIPRVVRWLMAQRQGSAWSTTQETSYALLALSDYVLSAQRQMAQQNWRVDVNGQMVAQGSFTTTVQGVKMTVPGTLLRAGENEFRLLHGGDGRLYYTVLARVYSAEGSITPAGQIGVGRRYTRPGGQPLTGPLHVGDVVEVHLTVTVTAEAWYVILYDPLPAGLEGLNERLATTSYAARDWWESEPEAGLYPYSRKDVRDDSVALFFTQLTPGTHTVTYLARATTAGTFHALPAEAYPMYRPEVWGRSAGDVVAIVP
jgi:uncharacterized protein YfaS (alpha-2-macroglobulin family)